MAYVVVVTGKVKAGRMAEFKEYFKPLADYVTANEPGALTYQLSVGADDPDTLCIYERYTSKSYLEEVHWASEPFKTFAGKVSKADLWESKSVTKYWEEPPATFGFHNR